MEVFNTMVGGVGGVKHKGGVKVVDLFARVGKGEGREEEK